MNSMGFGGTCGLKFFPAWHRVFLPQVFNGSCKELVFLQHHADAGMKFFRAGCSLVRDAVNPYFRTEPDTCAAGIRGLYERTLADW